MDTSAGRTTTLCFSCWICIILFVFACLLVLRAAFLVYSTFSRKCKLYSNANSLRTLLCIGSGGHTTEILRLIDKLNDQKYNPRLYIAADNDTSSEIKIHNQEATKTGHYEISRIPRSRNVNQSFTSAVTSTLLATLRTVPVVVKFKPDIIFCNGPGTCVPICVVAFLLRCLFIVNCRIVYVESICRVNTLSLTGKIIQYIADVVVVQWPELKGVCYKAHYFGRLT